MFHIDIVLKRIKRRLLGNLITVIVIFIGALLLLFSLNVMLDIRRQHRVLLDGAADATYTVSSRNIPAEPQTHFISESRLTLLHGIDGLRVNVSINYNIITFAGKSHSENGEDITDKYTLTFSEDVSEIRAEKEFAEVLPLLSEKNTVNFYDIDFSRIDVFGVFDDGEKYVHSCVLPLDMYWKIAQPSVFSEFVLTAVCENANAYKSIPDLKEILSSGEYDFYIGNEFYDFLSKSSYAEQAMAKITFFAIIMLTVIFISTVCVFLSLIEERSFEISVCRAAGAGAVTVLLEFIAELSVISLTPTFVSALVNAFVFGIGVDFSGVIVSRLNFSAVSFGVAGVLIAGGICIIPIAFKLYRLKPYELLATGV